jgi:magnesium transporter
MGMVVDSALYVDGRRSRAVACEEATPPTEKNQFVWIGLYEPSEDLLHLIQARFQLHDLAIEDAHAAHQRPKIDVYGQTLFTVLRTAQMVDGVLEAGETHIFLGPGYVITVRHGISSSYAEVRGRCEALPKLLRNGVDFVLYAIMDFVIDNYFPIVDSIEAEVDEMHENVLEDSFRPDKIARIAALRRDLTVLRRMVLPLVDMSGRCARAELPMIDKALQPYFRDVQDHATRLVERVEGLREGLISVLEANMLIQGTRQNQVMQQLAAWAAILAVPTAIAGIYGMNFDHMPELHWRLGYPAVLGLIAVVCGLLFRHFKRMGWL